MSGRSVPGLPNSTLHLDATRRSPWLKHLRTFLAVAAGIVLIALLQWMIALPEPISSEPPAVSPSFDAVPNALQTAALAEVPVVRSTVEFPDDLQTLLNRGEYERLRQQLMRLAAGAAQQLDDQAMGNALTLLGVTALSENDTDSAAVYLQEALAIYEEIGDEVGGANANLQIGRLHVMERRRARRAALAYDTGLLARWKIANGQFSDAAPSLQRAIEENIELHRFGAAARDLETLATGYLDSGQWDEAAHSAVEAAKLHAASGRLSDATALLDKLGHAGISLQQEELAATLSQLDKEYQASVEQLGRARDYNQLYRQLVAQGDPVRAWQFRMQANASLALASKRARYRRQAGVLVLLYNSNDNMNKARDALQSARQVFSTRSLDSMSQQSEQLLREVY